MTEGQSWDLTTLRNALTEVVARRDIAARMQTGPSLMWHRYASAETVLVELIQEIEEHGGNDSGPEYKWAVLGPDGGVIDRYMSETTARRMLPEYPPGCSVKPITEVELPDA